MTFSITTLGAMSGTSVDGLDLACCKFDYSEGRWSFEVLASGTIPYTSEWRSRLHNALHSSGQELARLHADFGRFTGQEILRFMEQSRLTPDAICSHGHTVYHRPDLGYTFQAGCGAAIAAITGIDTVCDLRTTDVALGGQGAPLVPIGDRLLFGGHKFCLNLGGIANISFDTGNKRVAYDICPVNMALNFLAKKKGHEFDENGDFASAGRLIPGLSEKLRVLPFYSQPGPKSLGREWFESEFLPLINTDAFPVDDLLHTVTHHVADCIARNVPVSPGSTILVTGGGAFNSYLMECIDEQLLPTGVHTVVPDPEIVSFKEAIIFAFLGALRIKGTPNALSSVTGASRDSIGGALYRGK
jgi:anhydro-N-acetylmuramic acid kinase